MELNKTSEAIVGTAIKVHRALGTALFESACAERLCHELRLRSIPFERQTPLPDDYTSSTLDCGYRVQLLVAGAVGVEFKACEAIQSIHTAHVLSNMKLGAGRAGCSSTATFLPSRTACEGLP